MRRSGADLLDDAVEELAAAHELHDEGNLVGAVEDIVQLDTVNVVDALKDLDFPLYLSCLLQARGMVALAKYSF